MHDIRAIRENPAAFDAALARRGESALSSDVLALDEARRAKIQAAEEAQAEQNKAAKAIGAAKAKGDNEEFERLRAAVAEKKAEVAATNAALDVQDAVNRANTTIGELEGKYEEIFEQLGALSPRYDALSAKVESVNSRQDSVSADLQSAIDQFSVLKKTLDEASDRSEQLSASTDALTDRVNLMSEEATNDRFLVNYLRRSFLELDNPPSRRKSAIIALGLLGPRASSHWSELSDIWRQRISENYYVELEFTLALLRIDPPQTQQFFLSLLSNDETPKGIRRAIHFDEFLGPYTVDGVSALRELVFASDPPDWYELSSMSYDREIQFRDNEARTSLLELVVKGLKDKAVAQRHFDLLLGVIRNKAFQLDIPSVLEDVKEQLDTATGDYKTRLQRIVEELESTTGRESVNESGQSGEN